MNCKLCNNIVLKLNIENNNYLDYYNKLYEEINIIKLDYEIYDYIMLNIIFFLVNEYISDLKNFLNFHYLDNIDDQINYIEKIINMLNYYVIEVQKSKYFFHGITFNMISDIFHNNNFGFIYYKKIHFVNEKKNNKYGLNFKFKEFNDSNNENIYIKKEVINIQFKINNNDYIFSENHKCYEIIEKNNYDLDIIQENIKELKKNIKYYENKIKIKKDCIKNIIISEKNLVTNKSDDFVKFIWKTDKNKQIFLLQNIINEINIIDIKFTYNIYNNKYIHRFGWK